MTMHMNMAHRLLTAELIRLYMFSGRAKFTLVSLETGKHFTYQINRAKKDGLYFCKLLTGSDIWTYIGIIVPKLDVAPEDGDAWHLVWTKNSKVSKEAPSFKGLNWFLRMLAKVDMDIQLRRLPASEYIFGEDKVAFYHSGRCGRCGRELTEPESIRTGLGPYCRSAN